jgi:hypothetical protein
MKRELIGVMELESGIGDFAKVARRCFVVPEFLGRSGWNWRFLVLLGIIS